MMRSERAWEHGDAEQARLLLAGAGIEAVVVLDGIEADDDVDAWVLEVPGEPGVIRSGEAVMRRIERAASEVGSIRHETP